MAQSWDPRHGHEVLRLRAPGYEQELRFAFVDGVWWPAGGTLWQRRSDGELARMWSLLHEELHPVDGTVLPRRTRLAGPSSRRQDLVIITYGAQTVDPALGDSSATASDDDAGWEDEDTASPPSDGDGGDGDASPPPVPGDTPAATPPAPAEAAIPPQFTLDGAGLAPRGELCR
ncbi:hypothetical protein OV079_37855 [Nannocystis pusilla]|uniref:Uncharacterized protein n=1 Tax=Nannocystis pusilla TaxID=889268 RepID=A0A9X3EX84_9BACT|nr:hypothetical protein [Nannocystis pusilla]MCY1011229.1 hypothetical protein [Nannocystis pusilla]